MRFYGSGGVYNKSKRKVDIRFINGVFETDDPAQIERLKECGFRYDAPAPEEPEPKEEPEALDLTKDELIELAAGLAAPSTLKRWSIEKLKRAISESD